MIHLRRCLANISSKHHGLTTTRVKLVHNKSKEEHPTAGIIVVGDEILKAQVRDTNSFYASHLLYKHGVRVQKITVVRDDVQDIARAIKRFSGNFNYVFTTGGIGPTHDDVTYQALGLAFDDTLHYHPKLVDIVKNRFGCNDFPSPAYKMAYIPTKSVLKFCISPVTGEAFPYPCIELRNVFVFPGSPMFFEFPFQALCKELFSGYKSFSTVEVFLNAREDSFANVLNDVVRKCPNVTFGSYPETNRYYKARITIESENEEDTEAAKRMFCSRVPSGVLVNYDRTPHVDALSKYEQLLENSERRSIYQKSFEIFLDYCRKPEEVWIYLDGCAESVVMVHLARVTMEKLGGPSKTKLRGICPTANKFLQEISNRYNVELCCLKNNGTVLIRPEMRMLLLGKRSNGSEREIEDYQRLERLFSESLPSVQIHFPLIEWTDEDVASFVGSLSIHYHTADEV
ncbi:FAD synthase [Halictus rubicundus]|uniref:FAD synthase n=1 Tax=Halictus rubicundus TaxID=77578 RepID=UPI0040358654